MKVPGRAWLEFEVREAEGGGSTIRPTAVFDPAGLLGLAYWYGVYPLHALVFAGLLRGIAGRAVRDRDRAAMKAGAAKAHAQGPRA